MKNIIGFLTLSIALILTACNNDDDSSEEKIPAENDKFGEQHDKTSENGDDIINILEQSVGAMSDIDSFAVDMNTAQEVNVNDESFTTETEANTEVTLEPFAYYEEAAVVDDEGTETMNTEVYFTDDGFYTYEAFLDEWMILPEEVEADIRTLHTHQRNPERQLELLMAQVDVDNMSAEDHGDHYAVTVSGDEEGLLEVAAMMIDNLDGGMGMVVEDIMSLVDVNEINYEILIDKETHYFQEFNAQIDMDVTVEEGQSAASQQVITTTYDAFNDIDEITIPENIRENAEEVDFEQELDGENE
ncbi:DUF6612 family protein [Natribacillus halophilus]|nr:DUF6612 family protein [Natribacillus halophilus]